MTRSLVTLLASLRLIACTMLFNIGAHAAVSPTNEALLKATDPYEELAEVALGGEGKKIAKALKVADAGKAATRALLSADRTGRFDELSTLAAEAQKKGDYRSVALEAAEIYKLLVLALDPTTLVVPREVSLLDYSGFRTNALLAGSPPDWTALRETAAEANAYWAKVREQVRDKKLQARMDAAQHGLMAAAEKKDAALSRSAARDNLDLVDKLESHFSK